MNILKFFSRILLFAFSLFLISNADVFAQSLSPDVNSLVVVETQDKFDRFFKAVDEGKVKTKEEGIEVFEGIDIPDLNPRNDLTDVTGAKSQIVSWGNTFAAVIALIAVIMIIYGGYLYVTAGTNEDNTKKAKSILVFSVIGLAIAVLSYTIVRVAVSFIGDTSAPAAPPAGNTYTPY